MSMIVKAALAAAAVWAFAGEAIAQSQGPLTTLPWATRSRTKPNPDHDQQQQPATADQNLLQAPPSTKPLESAPEVPKEKLADR